MSSETNRDKSEYTFGTSSVAAQRLEKIAEYFNPGAVEFIRSFIAHSCESALDLGCGPGFTTNMLRQATRCDKTYGMDSSEEFLKMAEKRFPHCTFLKHDVTSVPFPLQTAIIYVRFLLSHLKNPIELVNQWTTQLKPDGLLLIEEVEDVQTDVEVFNTYLQMNEGMIAAQGASLFVGRELSEGSFEAKVLLNECSVMPVANHQAASWFLPNTQSVWNEDQYVLERLSSSERNRISQEIAGFIERQDTRSNITWRMRRLVLRSTKS